MVAHLRPRNTGKILEFNTTFRDLPSPAAECYVLKTKKTYSCNALLQMNQIVTMILKQNYRKHLLERFLNDMEYNNNHNPVSVNYLCSMHYISAFWDSAKLKTI